ncbi:s-adenosyl-l-methionine-dependent methyltransferases superfamily protein [Citrus sinensis]|nr:s-adenosyl-l-methionine-dependent methyltransferases superfamily protein [Citrus sinensis]
MVVVNVPCMNGGGGETSYAKNSNIQRTVMSKAWPFLEETIKDMFSSSFPGCFNVADLGCSSGPNTLLVPENLENNKRDIYITKSSPPSVCQAFWEQFQRDFSAFLSLRSEEIVSGGRMFLTFLGRSIADPSSKDCCCLWELLTKSLIQLANEEEVKSIVREQGSFNLDTFESFEVNWDPSDDVNNKSFVFNKDRCGQNVANSIRAVTEPMLASHFGNAVIDPLFARFATLVAEHLAVEKTKHISLVFSMTRKQHAQPDLDI